MRTTIVRAGARVARAGADAFLDSRASTSQLLAALRGAQQTPPTVAARRRHRRDHEPSLADRLTPRELDVLRSLSLGRTTRQMCAEFGIGPNTVRTHVQNIIGKLRVHSRLEAVALATRERLV